MSQVRLTASDGHILNAYLATPAGKARGGIVVLQEIFGVNAHIRDICDRLAAEGYVAVAPAIFDRIAPGFESGYSPDEVAAAKELMGRFDFDACLLDLAAARVTASVAGRVGVLGFCLGGSLAFLAAVRSRDYAAASCFYGGRILDFADEIPHCPVQLHYGGTDASIPADNYRAVQKKRPEAEFHLYEGAGHGFNCDMRSGYDETAAKLAWSRMLDFFANTVG